MRLGWSLLPFVAGSLIVSLSCRNDKKGYLRANEVSTGPRSELTRRRSWLATGTSDAGWVIRLGLEVEDEAWEDIARYLIQSIELKVIELMKVIGD